MLVVVNRKQEEVGGLAEVLNWLKLWCWLWLTGRDEEGRGSMRINGIEVLDQLKLAGLEE